MYNEVIWKFSPGQNVYFFVVSFTLRFGFKGIDHLPKLGFNKVKSQT